MSAALAYTAATLVALWGVAHASPTQQVVAGFEPTAPDNHRVILQEWLAESIAMWGLAALVITVTATGGNQQLLDLTYRIVAGILLALAALTSLTGARTRVVWFKVCPVLLTATMLVVASLL